MQLNDGSTVAVIGGGPAGAFVSYFLKLFSRLLDIDIHVDIYEPKVFSSKGAKGLRIVNHLLIFTHKRHR